MHRARPGRPAVNAASSMWPLDAGAIEALCRAPPATRRGRLPAHRHQRAAQRDQRAAEALAGARAAGVAGAVRSGFTSRGRSAAGRAGADRPADTVRAGPIPIADSTCSTSTACADDHAPERPGARRDRPGGAHGIAVSLGDTDATYDRMIAGTCAGATLGTHLYNAMSPFGHPVRARRRRPHRRSRGGAPDRRWRPLPSSRGPPGAPGRRP